MTLYATFAFAQSPAPGASDSWEPLRFLIGRWDAKTGGESAAAASGTYTFQLEMRSHVLARHSAYGSCKGPADFDCEHSDLLYMYRDAPGQSLKAIYLDNEGHTIHYTVSTPVANTAVFLSESVPGPQFRLMYELKSDTMFGKFQMRMPGQTEFKSYLEWSGKKH